jgi:hypothetical protein
LSESPWGRLIDRNQSGGVAPVYAPFGEILVIAPIRTSTSLIVEALARGERLFIN